MGLNCAGPIIRGLFSINMQSAFRTCRFLTCRFKQAWIKNSTYFQCVVANPWMWRADCIHCSVSFYIRDLTSLYFGIHGVPVPSPLQMWGTTVIKFLGSQKLYANFQCESQCLYLLHGLNVNCIVITLFHLDQNIEEQQLEQRIGVKGHLWSDLQFFYL